MKSGEIWHKKLADFIRIRRKQQNGTEKDKIYIK